MQRRWSRNWAKALVLSIFVVAAALIFAAAWRWFSEPAGAEALAGVTFEFPRLGCRYLKPNPPWKLDSTGIKERLQAVLVMHRAAPQAWLALLAKDYQGQARDGDLREEAIRRMRGYFHEDNLEWKPGEETALASRRALRLVFRGEVDNNLMSGECCCLVDRGIAYWFLLWAPADQVASAKEEFEDLRRRFSLQDRKDASELHPATRTFHGRKIDYTLQDGADLWREWTPATDYDVYADLALVAGEKTPRHKDEDPNAAVAASVVVLVLKGTGENLDDAVRAAKVHLEAEQKVAYPETTIETAAEMVPAPEPGERIGNATRRVVRLHVRNGETRQRYVMLAVFGLPDQLLVLQCESAWKQRATWEPLFEQLLSTLRLANRDASTVDDHGRVSPAP